MQKQTVIAVINEKGGTAKTTTTVNLAAALGEAGQKVLLVDLDGQAASSRWLGVEEDNRLAEAMCRGGGLVPIPDLLTGVSLVPASGRLDSVAHELRPTQGGQLRKILNELVGFDYVLIDCPPSLGNRLIANGLMAATHVIVPVETSILALDGLKILLTTLEDVQEGFGHQIVLGGVLACRYDGRTRLSRLVLEELRRALPGKVFSTVIRENVRMRECPASTQSILTFATDSPGAQDYRALAQELLAPPQAWRNPITMPRAGSSKDASQFSVDNLRQNAAASLRESARNTLKTRPAKDDGADSLPSESPLEAEVTILSPQASPVASGNADSSALPAGKADEPVTKELEVWLDQLEQAEHRLAVHAEEPQPVASPTVEAEAPPAPPSPPDALTQTEVPLQQAQAPVPAPEPALLVASVQQSTTPEAAAPAQGQPAGEVSIKETLDLLAGTEPQTTQNAPTVAAAVQPTPSLAPGASGSLGQTPAATAQSSSQVPTPGEIPIMPVAPPLAPGLIETPAAAQYLAPPPAQPAEQSTGQDKPRLAAFEDEIRRDLTGSDPQDKFPALRAHLKKMEMDGRLSGAKGYRPPQEDGAQDEKKSGGLRHLLRKMVGAGAP